MNLLKMYWRYILFICRRYGNFRRKSNTFQYYLKFIKVRLWRSTRLPYVTTKMFKSSTQFYCKMSARLAINDEWWMFFPLIALKLKALTSFLVRLITMNNSLRLDSLKWYNNTIFLNFRSLPHFKGYSCTICFYIVFSDFPFIQYIPFYMFCRFLKKM